MQWQKENMTTEQLRADEDDCRERAWHEASLRAWEYNGMWGPAFRATPMGAA